MIYLDNAATTKISPEVLDAMMPYLTNEFGNAGSVHKLGTSALRAVQKARESVAALIGAAPSQIVFTSGGSEANSVVFSGVARTLLDYGKPSIITTLAEHESVIKSAQNLRDKCHFDAFFVGVGKDASVNLDELKSLISHQTGLVSAIHTNNETGAVNPVSEIGDACRKYNALFHTDCVQATGSSVLDVNELGCDFLSMSSHKIHGPKGVGALFVKDRSVLSPLIFGGRSQEFGLRGGTENVAGIVGFGKACEIVKENISHDINTISRLNNEFISVLQSKLAQYGLDHILHKNNCKGKIANIRFDNIDGETLLLLLDAHGVCVSSGSACRSHESEPSHVLTAIGLSESDARSSIRISFSVDQSVDDVVEAASILSKCVLMLYDFKEGD